MGKFSALVGVAALAGIGFYVGKKLIEKRNAEEEERQHVFEDDSQVFVEEKHSSPKEKIQRASLFAVGAIKTGTEKFKEGIDDIINNDMVAKGETTVAETKEKAGEAKEKAVNFAKDAKEKTVDFAKDAKEKTVDFAKNTGENIKGGIENIKTKVTQKADEAADGAADLAEAIEKDVDDLANTAVDMAEAVKDPEAIVERIENAAQSAADEYVHEAEEEVSKASDDIDSISVDSLSSDSVETFDFSKPEQL